MRSLVCAMVVLVVGPVVACPVVASVVVRALKTEDVAFRTCRLGPEPRPVEITSADELAKSGAFTDDAGRKAIQQQIDFTREKLVVFVWAGSRSDTFTSSVGAGGVARFVFTPGTAEDFIHHTFAYAVSKDAPVEVQK